MSREKPFDDFIDMPTGLAAASSATRAGAVLIIVTGLAMVLLGIAMTFMLRMRADSQETRIVVAEAQARLMLHAGLMFIQEESRLGWGEETFGWTDVRDGSLGPRPARDVSTGATGVIPQPSWWKGSWGAYVGTPTMDDSTWRADSTRTWPCPGAVGRFPMAVPVQPPYATQLTYAYNPVNAPQGSIPYGQPNYENPWVPAALGNDPILLKPGTGGVPMTTASYWPIAWTDTIFSPQSGATASLDPQPQADVWHDATYTGAPGQKPDFISGAIQQGVAVGDWKHVVDDGITRTSVQLKVRPGSENVCWFRVYREIQADHDGDGSPAYDRVVMWDRKNPDLRNWNVFIVACGVGSTRGYRFWDLSDLNTWRTANGLAASQVSLGQEFASTSGLFVSQADFNAARASTRVVWYRVEWSPLQGGGFIPEKYSWSGSRVYNRPQMPLMSVRPFPGWDAHRNQFPENENSDRIFGISPGGSAEGLRYSAPKTNGGNFRWVQRLDHEPPNW